MKKTIIGYADQIGVAPGETLSFMVSCDGVETYDASIVRLVAGPGQTDDPAARERACKTAIDGRHAGRYQPIHAGSFVLIEDRAAFRDLANNFTIGSAACRERVCQYV